MPSQLSHLTQQGLRAFERKEYAAALESFRAVLAVRPDFADVLHHTGLCMIFLGQLEEGLTYLDRALDVNPAYIEAHINRALMLQELGRYDEAREAFDRARQHEEQSHGRFAAAVCTRLANGHTAVADMYMEADDIENALVQYRAALELRPGFHDIRNKYATALMAAGRLDDAAAELTHVLEANPRFLAARLNLGLVHYRRGRFAEAAAEWHSCETQHAGNPQVRAYLAMLEQADDRAIES